MGLGIGARRAAQRCAHEDEPDLAHHDPSHGPACDTADVEADLSEDLTVLRVLCSTHELEEDGEVVRIGDHISRLASRNETIYYGTELDTVQWRFDSEAEAAGTPAPTISGRVAAISAVYVRLTGTAGVGWTAQHGSAHLEPLESTAAARRIQHAIDWGPATAPDEHAHAYRAGYPRIEEGDEHLSGWVISLEPAEVDTPLQTS